MCQVDSDDLWPRDALERLATAIAGAPRDVAVVYGRVAYLNTLTDQVERIREANLAGRVHAELLEDHCISHCGAAMRIDAFRKVGGYDEALQLQEDSDLLIRLADEFAVLPVPEVVYVVRLGDTDRLMLKSHEGRIAQEQLFQKHAADLARYPRARYRQLLNILSLAAWDRDWARVLRLWVELIPSAWRAPQVFRETQAFLADTLLSLSKRQYWTVRSAAGRRIKRR